MRVRGKVRPLSVKPVPLADAAEIVRLDPPELVKVSVRVFELPTTTFPKLKLAGFGAIWPCVTPTPESGIASVGLFAFEVIVRVPLRLPAAVGENVVLNVVLCPAPRVAGRFGPVTVNPVPVAAADEIVTATPPVFVIVTGTV